MAAGQLFAEQLYPIMSNTGILIFIITIEAVMVEVDKDIVAIENEASFLVCVALKGDQISVARPSVMGQLQDEETPTIIPDHQPPDDTDTTGEAVQQDGGVASSELAEESEDQNQMEEIFQDEETPSVKGVAFSTPEEFDVKNEEAMDDNIKNESEEIETTSNDKKER